MPKWGFGSIRNRVLALFLAVVLAFTLAVMIITGVLTRSLVTDLVVENAQALVHHQSHIISLWQ
ncbi:MAG: hypothetical protein QM373_07295, partial [Bacillota bacterium]|nr:hypothetical protein [Bacillota bacterium]